MARIKVNLSSIRTANYNVPGIVTKVEIPKRNLGILKWRISEEITARYNIKNRLNDVYNRMESVQRQISDVYNITNSCISQYEAAERDNSKNADAFL